MGKGENGSTGSIGGFTDITTRIDNTGRNRYNPTNEYSSVNVDAISDGDEMGKGENGSTGSIGSLTDINRRIDNTGRNMYGTTHTYPDF